MAKPKKTLTAKYGVFAFMLLLALFALTQSVQTTHAQTPSNPWQMTLQTQLIGSNSTSTVFSPFDPIQFTANVTYNNSSQPDMLVYFNVTGPTGSSNPTVVDRIETTNASGLAVFSMRLPIENESTMVGNWQAFATLQTSSGIIQQNVTFTTQWNMQITSLSLLNSQSQSQTVFAPGDYVTVQVAISNQGPAQAANVTFNMQDSTGQTINQTQIQNSQIANSNQTQVQTTLEIPNSANPGQASINVAIYTGTYNGINIPAAENQNAHFTITSNTSSNPTPSSSASPTPGPTPTPDGTPNTVSLFYWLLVATGLFTFTLLILFLRRKPKGGKKEIPNLPPTTEPTGSSQLSAQPVEQLASQAQETRQPTSETTKIATEKTFEATIPIQTSQTQTQQTMQEPTALIEVGKPEMEIILPAEPTLMTTPTQQDTVSSTAKVIQAIKTAKGIQAVRTLLNSEEEQLVQDLARLTATAGEKEKALANYIFAVRQEIENAKATLTETKTSKDTEEKTGLQSAVAQEPIMEAMTLQANIASSRQKRIQALKLVLKLESEQLTDELKQLSKSIDDKEKEFNDHISSVRREIEKLKTQTTEKETQTPQ